MKMMNSMKIVKSKVPIIHIILLVIFSVTSIVLGINFRTGLSNNKYIVGPWTNLLLLISAIGLTLTVAISLSELVYKSILSSFKCSRS